MRCLKIHFLRYHLQKRVIYIFVISTLLTQTYVIQSQINLEFHCFYLEIAWKIMEFRVTR